MGEYYSCSSCGNQEEGDSIYRCCGKTYCDSCVKGIMSNLIHSRCPECGGAAKYLGRIESRSSDNSSSDSDDDDDDGPAPTLSELLDYAREHKDTWSSEKKEKLSKTLLSYDWSEYPDAETLYNEINS